MNEKGFEAEITLGETPSYDISVEKPLNLEKNKIKKVDINVLKARAQNAQNKENKKSIIILIFFLIVFAGLGVFLSL